MNIKKEVSFIQKCLMEMETCKDADRFYQLCTSLYFRLNSIVFNFQYHKYKIDNFEVIKKDDNNFNKFMKLG